MVGDRKGNVIDGHFAGFRSLVDSQPELARDLLGRMMTKSEELEKRLRLNVVAIVLAAITFELLNRNLLGEASALGIKVAKLGFLRYVVPVAIAFLLLRFLVCLRDGMLLDGVIKQVCAVGYPEVIRSNVLPFALPGGGVLSDVSPPEELIGRRATKIRSFIDSLEVVVAVLVVPVGFTAYAVVQLFRHSNSPHVAAAIATSLTVLVLIMAVAVVISIFDEVEREAP